MTPKRERSNCSARSPVVRGPSRRRSRIRRRVGSASAFQARSSSSGAGWGLGICDKMVTYQRKSRPREAPPPPRGQLAGKLMVNCASQAPSSLVPQREARVATQSRGRAPLGNPAPPRRAHSSSVAIASRHHNASESGAGPATTTTRAVARSWARSWAAAGTAQTAPIPNRSSSGRHRKPGRTPNRPPAPGQRRDIRPPARLRDRERAAGRAGPAPRCGSRPLG